VTIESDIVAWALERPGWQQEVLVALAEGEVFDGARLHELADQILQPDSAAPNKEASKLSIRSSVVEQVQLTQVANACGVNSLVEGQSLLFEPAGLTVIYGDNGSGKSGYARLIKSMVKARHTASVLPDVFRARPESPTAELIYTVAGQEQTQKYPDTATPEMLKMSFHDEHCGDEYLSTKSTVTYRPSALSLLDGLVRVCDGVRAVLQARIDASERTALKLDVPPGTTAGTFAFSLTARTTADQIDQATRLTPDANEQLASVLQDEARLTGSNPEEEKARLSGLARQLRGLSSDISTLLTELGVERTATRVAAKATATDLRAAADLAATKSFDAEPLPGVGAETWRSLWNAAREFSLTEAYQTHEFPVTDDGAVCVLCQQPLSETAKDRFDRFNQFMTDTTARDARAAEGQYQGTLAELRGLVIQSPARSTALAALNEVDTKLSTAVAGLLSKLDDQREAIVEHLTSAAPLPAALPEFGALDKVKSLGTDLQGQADALDVAGFRDALTTAKRTKAELQASIKLSESAAALKAEVARLKELARLQAAKSAADTSAITQKSVALTRHYVTKQILDQFTREAERLDLQKVTLDDLGGRKGQLNQKPSLLGTTHRGATATTVLSEGEQTALGLAGFFTEATFDESKSALVFDDPVTSLDHVRRDKVAARLAQLARDRQVIVFTHDVSFVVDLARSAAEEGVSLAERSIERRGLQPGVCLATFPWKAKDFGSRIDDLRVSLQMLMKERPDLETSVYEERVASWAGKLSELWERCISTEIIDQIFDRGKSEVRVMKFRLLAGITESDDKDFQEGYGSTSKWSRRHDKSPITNYVAPEPPDLQKELDRLVSWQKRLKGYLKSK
jgi:energy-coupling factor transporter ATP-binding protein EcfA2